MTKARHSLAVAATSAALAGVLCAALAPAAQAQPDGPFFPQIAVRGMTPSLPPWSARRRPGFRGKPPLGRFLIDPRRWPREPQVPPSISAARFARAYRALCARRLPSRRLHRVANAMLNWGRHFGVDPFVLAALSFRESRCHPRRRGSYGVGLTAISPSMHRRHLRRRVYDYWVLERQRWVQRQLPLRRYPFTRSALLAIEPNIYFAAAFLRIFTEQRGTLRAAYPSVRYVHPVSHFAWGDRVRDGGAEVEILRARRRMLRYYHGAPLVPVVGRWRELALGSPLDGAPRLVTSVIGDDRDNGRRRHTGVDFASVRGEPVRAVAPGVVTLAGADLGHHDLRSFPPSFAPYLRRRPLGPRGVLVAIRHPGGLTSVYMHLAIYSVRRGQRVKRGQLIGRVGRTGIKHSAAHLHFELQVDGVRSARGARGRPIDPMVLFSPRYVIGPSATFLGRRVALAQWQARQKRRARRHRRMQRRRRRVMGRRLRRTGRWHRRHRRRHLGASAETRPGRSRRRGERVAGRARLDSARADHR